MVDRLKSHGYNIFFAGIAFVIAIVCYSGVVLADDMTGRMIYGATWTLVGIFWIPYSNPAGIE